MGAHLAGVNQHSARRSVSKSPNKAFERFDVYASRIQFFSIADHDAENYIAVHVFYHIAVGSSCGYNKAL
jgi:hypothetical protein